MNESESHKRFFEVRHRLHRILVVAGTDQVTPQVMQWTYDISNAALHLKKAKGKDAIWLLDRLETSLKEYESGLSSDDKAVLYFIDHIEDPDTRLGEHQQALGEQNKRLQFAEAKIAALDVAISKLQGRIRALEGQ